MFNIGLTSVNNTTDAIDSHRMGVRTYIYICFLIPHLVRFPCHFGLCDGATASALPSSPLSSVDCCYCYITYDGHHISNLVIIIIIKFKNLIFVFVEYFHLLFQGLCYVTVSQRNAE